MSVIDDIFKQQGREFKQRVLQRVQAHLDKRTNPWRPKEVDVLRHATNYDPYGTPPDGYAIGLAAKQKQDALRDVRKPPPDLPPYDRKTFADLVVIHVPAVRAEKAGTEGLVGRRGYGDAPEHRVQLDDVVR